MLVKMTKTEKGSNDGRFVTEYLAGKKYDLSEALAKAFIALGVAEDAKPEAPAEDAKPEEPRGKARK